MAQRLEGIYPAVVTCFGEDHSLDLERWARLLERVLQAGVAGVYVGGNIGEWYLLTLEERKLLARTAIQVCRGRGKVIVHVGCPRTSDAVELARHAEQEGADAISSLPPYAGRWTASEILEYFRRLADATALAFLVYYFPALTGTVSGDGFLDAVRSLPGVSGFKFTDMNLYDLGCLAASCGADVAVLSGHDQVLVPGLLMGAAGGIGAFYNLMPERFVSAYRSFEAGDCTRARDIQRDVNRVIRVIRKYRTVPAIKFVSKLQGLDLGCCRPPTMELNAGEQRSLEGGLREAGFLC